MQKEAASLLPPGVVEELVIFAGLLKHALQHADRLVYALRVVVVFVAECPEEETKFDKFDRLYSIFKSLTPTYQDCALEQIKSLADLQDQTKD